MSRPCPPLVSLAQLHELEDSLGGETALCKGFVNNYVNMWSGRFQRLASAVTAEDLDDAMDAALSLCTSSHMVGAQRLEQCTQDLIKNLRNGCLGGATAALPSLGRCGQRTVDALLERYVRRA
ncbi:Hpt domain-containing protein [Arthrobacter sp. STN4]|uniref:Hpt domain-containing protein n=1 Tax=Arthrobacter sp. STN4 TaxID=2923276 RepID=UPI002119F373|nr:Hpt domain-containing protein [Arthrobacter sp. STN4]MCQ9163339.1 Hpt domain-containing protein [Arthrobacter sp. STN4]